MAKEVKKTFRYFLYSREQYKTRVEIEKKIGKRFKPGKVLINGKWELFTEISATPNNQFSDSKIVAKGYLEDMKYDNNMSSWEVL